RGTYAVTVTLTGFSTVKGEGIELTSGFTAPVDAEMKVGSLEETVLVESASPVVDVQNVGTQNTLTREILDEVPNAQAISSFSAAGRAFFTNNSFQASNLGSDLTSRGATSAQSAKLIYDDGVSVGGPILKNRLWFFAAFRRWGAEEYQPNAFYNAVQGTGLY